MTYQRTAAVRHMSDQEYVKGSVLIGPIPMSTVMSIGPNVSSFPIQNPLNAHKAYKLT